MNNGKLERQLLMDVGKENNHDKTLFEKIKLMKNLIEKYKYEKDDRFYTFGRRDIVINEFNNNILEKNINDAYGNLQDIINCDDFLPINVRDEIINKGLDYNKIQNDMNNYKNEGFICLQEKDIIMDMINKLKTIIGNETNMNYEFYLINEKRLLCSNKNNTFELIDGRWNQAEYTEIGDRLMGYDSSEKGSLYGIGNTDTLSEIKKLTREQAIEFAGEDAINSLL